MKVRTTLSIALSLMLIAALPALVSAGERRDAEMQTLPGFVTVDGSSISVNATAKKATFNIKTSGLTSGNAYTIWVFSFANPAACTDSECGEDDADDQPDVVGFAVNQAAGKIVGNGDNANFGGSVKVDNPKGSEFHVVVADHGPKDPAQMPLQIKSPSPDGVQIGIILP